MNQSKKLINFLFVLGVLIALYLWGSVYQNIQANPISGEAQISFLDVGEGDSILINLPGSIQILIDGGRQGRILSNLDNKMPRHDGRIEYIIESHPDADHIGGLIDVLKNYEVGQIIKTDFKSNSQTYANLEDQIKLKNITMRSAYQGDTLFFDGARAKVLSPLKYEIQSLSSNNSSIVLKFIYKNSCAILLGDAELEAQNKILANFKDELPCDLIKISHHGSAGAYSEDFVRQVNPKYAVISVGPNGYGHPAQDVILSLSNLTINLFRTDRSQTINFVSKDSSWQPL